MQFVHTLPNLNVKEDQQVNYFMRVFMSYIDSDEVHQRVLACPNHVESGESEFCDTGFVYQPSRVVMQNLAVSKLQIRMTALVESL